MTRKIENDPKPEIYRLMDEAGLTGGNMLQGKVSMTTLVNLMRQRLVLLIADYLKDRDLAMYEAGYERGKIDRDV